MPLVSGSVGELICRVKFTLSDNTQFTLNSNDAINQNNYLTLIKLKEELSAENNIPVGVNSSNVLDLEIISEDKVLIPENDSSPYYGKMNNSAIIEVYVTESNQQIYFGKYFVDTWKSSISSTEPNKVVISATCIMGVIAKMDVPDVMINSGTKIKNYLIALINELNAKLPNNKQILYNASDIKFSAFPTMQFSNLDTENMSNCLNSLSQSTLTNIYSSREGYIKTDYCCDDNFNEAVYQLDVMYSAEVGSGALVNYNGVKVNYSLGNILNVEELASLYDQHVSKNKEKKFKDIDLGEAVYKINRIEVTPEDDSVDVDIISNKTKYNKNRITVTVKADKATNISIKIYGQRLDTTVLTKEIAGSNQLEINNKIIESSLIDKYAGNINKLVGFKHNSMQVSGYFNPRIKLSDTVFVNCENAMSVNGYYKVVGLDWDLGAYGNCTMSLMKTFEMSYDIDEITNSLNEELEKTLDGEFYGRQYDELSAEENGVVNSALSTELSTLRTLLYGEA